MLKNINTKASRFVRLIHESNSINCLQVIFFPFGLTTVMIEQQIEDILFGRSTKSTKVGNGHSYAKMHIIFTL